MKEKTNKQISFKQRVWEIVEAVEHFDQPGMFYDWCDIFILSLIVLNVAAFPLQPELLRLHLKNVISESGHETFRPLLPELKSNSPEHLQK